MSIIKIQYDVMTLNKIINYGQLNILCSKLIPNIELIIIVFFMYFAATHKYYSIITNPKFSEIVMVVIETEIYLK